MNVPSASITTAKTNDLPNDLLVSPALPESPAKRPSWKVLALALLIAGVSDALSFVVSLILPAQLAIDMATALLLFLILGRRWAILPGLIAEAIPGMGIFPVWVLVVMSIIFYDDIKKRRA
jgi:hypothetical protein